MGEEHRVTRAKFECTACGFLANADHVGALNVLNRAWPALCAAAQPPTREDSARTRGRSHAHSTRAAGSATASRTVLRWTPTLEMYPTQCDREAPTPYSYWCTITAEPTLDPISIHWMPRPRGERRAHRYRQPRYR
ncbi:zinc ribbon domain-containing protein [Streptomyces sp. NPDC002133]|uniref:zinc ribbon domain-containing protein n=1 Tax=Streptomyces sp. NPDC002133 TaxID=3154409 RepID=UPI00331A27AB